MQITVNTYHPLETVKQRAKRAKRGQDLHNKNAGTYKRITHVHAGIFFYLHIEMSCKCPLLPNLLCAYKEAENEKNMEFNYSFQHIYYNIR